RSLRVACRSAPRDRRGQRAVPQVRRARERSGEEAEIERDGGSGFSRGRQGRKGELYGASAEGREGVGTRDSGFGIRDSGWIRDSEFLGDSGLGWERIPNLKPRIPA